MATDAGLLAIGLSRSWSRPWSPSVRGPRLNPNLRRGGPTLDPTKQARLIEMLRQVGGATMEEIVAATGWQSHTVRGAMSVASGKKLGLTVLSTKDPERGRVYRLDPVA